MDQVENYIMKEYIKKIKLYEVKHSDFYSEVEVNKRIMEKYDEYIFKKIMGH